MELTDYIKILKKNAYLVIVFVLLGAALALVFAQNFQKGSIYQQLFFVSAPKEAAAETYRFEGFYAQEKARNFTDTALAVLSSPDLATEAKVSARKIAPQVIRVSINSPDAESARLALSILQDGFNQKITQLTGSSEIVIKPISTSVVPVVNKLSPPVLVIFGAILGSIFALVVIGAKTYFKL